MGIEEKIKDIEEEIQKTPYNKATSHHIGKLKAKLSNQRSSSGTKGQGFHVKKSGDATVVLVGFPSVGKSTLLNELTNAESKVGAYQFTTLDIVPGVMEYKNAKIQVFDIPGIITGASSGKGRGREILSVARTAELIIVVLDVLNPQHLDVILKELRNIGIRPNERPPDVTVNRRRTGGVHVSSTVPLTHLDEKTIRSIINEYGMHNADVLFRDDVTMDQFIDVLDRNKSYVPMLILLNKVDLVDKAYLEEMKKQLPEFIPISADKKLNIDNSKLHFLQTKEYDNENDNSNVIYTKLDGYKFMFMGDAGVDKEKDILDKYNISDIDVLKVGHHGSKTSSDKNFIDEIDPKYSVISVGKNNRYGHPNKKVLNNLDGSIIYRTDQDGSIMFKIKKNKLKIETYSP